MRIKILILGLALFLIIPILAQEEKEVISSFESVVNRIDKFFSGSPIVLASEFSLGSKVLGDDGVWTGRRAREAVIVYYLLKFEKQEIGYDIQKTDSIITPYVGYVVISLWIKSNASYGDMEEVWFKRDRYSGDVERVEGNWGFQLAEDAKKVEKFAKCTSSPDALESYWCFGDIKLSYSYQKNKWIFKSVNTEIPNKIRRVRVREILEETIRANPEWKKVIK